MLKSVIFSSFQHFIARFIALALYSTLQISQYIKDREGHKKSVKVTCSSRFSRASQSPQLVEKQPKSTPDMPPPPHPKRRGYITYPHGHSLLLWRLVANFAKILRSREQRFNKRLSLCHRFFTLSVPATCILHPQVRWYVIVLLTIALSVV